MTEEIRFSVKELVQIFEKMPNWLDSFVITIIMGYLVKDQTMPRSLLHLLSESDDYKDIDLIKSLAEWNWDSHPPHTDDAILVLVEELLEEYRDL